MHSLFSYQCGIPSQYMFNTILNFLIMNRNLLVYLFSHSQISISPSAFFLLIYLTLRRDRTHEEEEKEKKSENHILLLSINTILNTKFPHKKKKTH